VLSLLSGRRLILKTTKNTRGFVLPLALTTSAVLLLGSASIHTLSLKGRLRLQAAIQREQSADQLRSAAQAFTALARGAEACLLRWPSADWNLRENECLGADPTALLSGIVGDQPWQLISWLPGSKSGRLQLALRDGRRGSFRLKLASDRVQILSISDVQLQGRLAWEALS
tara:strand:- start:443 stop:955 length:513 start_codon:yes stop_codon:yes gene_type:complete